MKDQLKAILEGVDPELFNDEAIDKLCTLFEARLDEKVTAEKEILMEKHLQEMEKFDAECAQKLQEVVDNIDDDHSKKLTDLVEKIKADHKSELEKIDEDSCDKLNKVVTHLKEKSTAKLNEKIEQIDEDHTKKLQQVIDFYENKYENKLVEAVGEFLDTFINENMPEQSVVDKLKLERYENFINDMKHKLSLTDDYIHGEAKDAIMEANNIIKSKEEKINSLLMEKVKINKELQKMKSKSLLVEKTAGMDELQKKYIMNFFENSSPAEINEKLDEAVKAYTKKLDNEREQLIEENKGKGTKVPNTKIDDLDLEEKVVLTESSDEMNSYVQAVKKMVNK